MGTKSTTKFLYNNQGVATELAALTTSAGAADAQALPALNASGVLDLTITNAKVGNTGAADSATLVARDSTGRIDVTDLPVGIGADTAVINATEALVAGDLVNVWNNAGSVGVRKADASAAGKEAMGFVLAAVSSGAAATVYFEGTDTQMTGLLGGKQYLSSTAPGKTQATPPTGAAQVVQIVGYAVSATAMNFQSQPPIVLAS